MSRDAANSGDGVERVRIRTAEGPEVPSEIAKDRPLVMVCRSGARSAQATVILQRSGFDRVANLNGGMLRWRAEGHAVETNP